MTFEEYQQQEFGYTCITTFWQDFSIADHFGAKAIKDTYRRAMKEWASDYKFLTELVLVLNHKCWHYYNKGYNALSQLYADLFYKARDYAETHLTGDEYQYYFNVTD